MTASIKESFAIRDSYGVFTTRNWKPFLLVRMPIQGYVSALIYRHDKTTQLHVLQQAFMFSLLISFPV